MSDTKTNPEEIESAASEYDAIFARLAEEEEIIEEVIVIETVSEEIQGRSDEENSETSEEIEAGETTETVADNEVAETPEDEATAPADEVTTTETVPDVEVETSSLNAEVDEVEITASFAELKPAIEAVLFVADEPVPFAQLCKVLGDVNSADVYAMLVELKSDYEARNSGLELREIAGGWRIMTRPQHHEFIRKYLKSKPSARLSLPALETLAVIAYRQPVTVPEILEIRGVTSSSAIKTLLEKRLIITKGRKETVGRPMMYGTSKEFLLQFGLRDLNELPSMEDFEELAS
ncbi:MAG: SMC-Scp complex subunit ScpB [Acidobacteria bacterium]|nr:SMC-Scp complex subunit ScpB [Acidobacteriota bacterium]